MPSASSQAEVFAPGEKFLDCAKIKKIIYQTLIIILIEDLFSKKYISYFRDLSYNKLATLDHDTLASLTSLTVLKVRNSLFMASGEDFIL